MSGASPRGTPKSTLVGPSLALGPVFGRAGERVTATLGVLLGGGGSDFAGGYGVEPDWRHGMWQGPLVVQGKSYKTVAIAPIGQLTIVHHVARYRYPDQVGYGLYEHMFIGPFAKYGMKDRADGAC